MLSEEPSESDIHNRITGLNKKNGAKEHNLTELFQIVVGHDDDSNFYFAQVHCVPDNKGFTPASNNLGVLLKNIRSELLKKDAQLRKVEPRPESRIILP